MRNKKSSLPAAMLGSLLLVGLSGCVSEQEARRQRDEAYKNGFTNGQLEERKRCDEKIRSIQAKNQATVNRLEQEKTALCWGGFSTGAIAGATGAGLLSLTITSAAAFYIRRKIYKDNSPDYEHTFKRPPPSVTEEI